MIILKTMIRQATSADIQQIKQLIDWAAANGKVLAREEKELQEVIHNFFVWVDGVTIVGCCSLEVYNKKLAEIRSLVVSAEYQNKGIGKALIEACMKKAHNLKIYEVLTITDKDVFFEKMGFSKCLNGQWALFVRP